MCFLEGVLGVCDVGTSRCVYPSNDCAGNNSVEGYVDAQGNCVPEPNDSSASPTVSASSASDTTSDGTTDGPTSEPSTTTGNPTSSPTLTSPSDTESTTSDESDSLSTTTVGDESTSTGTIEQGCATLENVTVQGVVSATTEFNDQFTAELAVDGNLSTSWFSSGPEGAGAPSVYTWRLDPSGPYTEICIDQVHFFDNTDHFNMDFRDGYGFASATIRLIDANDQPVFERLVPLPEDPDGDHDVVTGGVTAQRVVLELSGHENPTCGGFSELQIFGSTTVDNGS